MRPTQKECEYCGAGFISKRANRVYCGTPCGRRAAEARHRNPQRTLPSAIRQQLSEAYERLKERQP